MAVVDLSMQLSDFQEAAIAELGWASTAYTDLDQGERSEIDRLVLRAERTLFLHPPVDPPIVWSCLRDPGYLDLWGTLAVSSLATGVCATGSTVSLFISTTAVFTTSMVGKTIFVTGGSNYLIVTWVSSTRVAISGNAGSEVGRGFTVSDTVTGVYTAPSTELTATTASFYETMVGHSIAVTSTGSFPITGYTSSTVITVSGDATCTRKPYSIAADGIYRLPADFESPESSTIVFMSESWIPDISLTNEKHVTALRATQDQTGYPEYACIRWIASDGTSAQQQELVMWPTPDKYYQVSLPFMAQPQGMSDANPYPRGGPEMADCLLSLLLAICEEAKTGRRGDRWGEAVEKIGLAAKRDRTRHHNFIMGRMRPDAGTITQPFDVKRLVLPA